MSSGERTRMVVAIAVNLAVGQTVASWMGFPRWAGSVVAGGAMAAATVPEQLPMGAREVVQLAVLPGNLVAQALADQVDKLEKGESDA